MPVGGLVYIACLVSCFCDKYSKHFTIKEVGGLGCSLLSSFTSEAQLSFFVFEMTRHKKWAPTC